VTAYFDYRSRDALMRMESRLRYYEQSLLATRGLFQTRADLSREEFATFVNALGLQENYPGLQSLGYAVLLTPGEKIGHELLIKSQGLPDYRILPPGERGVYSAIIYMEPYAGRNLRAIGFDVLSEAVRREAVFRARDTGQPAMTGKVRLVQETDQDVQSGFIVFAPVFRHGSPTQTLEDRRRNLIGWVSAPFRMNDLMKGALGDGASDLDIEIYDGLGTQPEALMYDRDPLYVHANRQMLLSSHTLTFGGHSWTVLMRAMPGLLARHGRDASSATLFIGGLASLFAALLAFFVLDRWGKAELLKAQLEERVEERTRQLAEITHDLDSILGIAPIGVSKVVGRQQVWVNTKAEELFQYPKSEMELQSTRKFYPSGEAYERLGAEAHAVLAAGQVFDAAQEILRKDGTCILIRFIGKAIDPLDLSKGAIWLMEDITERRQVEAALKASEERFRTFFEKNTSVMLLIDPHSGAILDANETAAAYYGFTRGRLAGMNIDEINLLSPAGIREEMHRAEIEERNYFLFQHRLASGEVREVEVHATPVESSGHSMLLSIIHDITDRKLAEEERRGLQERMSQVQKLEALGVLVGGVAHNFNNVLAAIMATASLGERLALDPRDREAYRNIDKACVRGRDVVKSLMRFAQPTLSHMAPCALHGLLGEVRMLLEATTQNRIKIVEAFSEGSPWILGDADSLSHALMNLCINALDAMPEGGCLTFRTSIPQPGWIEVSVEDSGEGMTPEILARVTEPFFTTKPVDKGTGLGLSMAHGVIKAHGGAMDITSAPGAGTTVKLRIPTIPDPEPKPEAEVPSPPPGGLNVLLVDDDEDVLYLVARMLKAAGFQVKPVPGGEEALENLRSGAIPDLIILDQNMPRMSGVQTLEKIRLLLPEVPILISSGQPDIQNWECFRRPNVGVIPKPFEMGELLARMAEMTKVPR